MRVSLGVLIASVAIVGGACVPDGPTDPGTTTTTVATTSTTAATTTTVVPVTPPPSNQSAATVAGVPADAQIPSMTPDARFVAFRSSAANIVSGFAPTVPTIYRLDRTTGITLAVSVSPTGDQSNEPGSLPIAPESTDISDDGRFVLFTSQASNLVADATVANRFQTYVRDMDTGVTVRASQAIGVAPNNAGRYGRISHNGDYVSFSSASTNLGPVDPSSAGDAYRWTRATGAIARASVGLDALGGVVEPNGASQLTIPLDDGSVVFETKATNVVSGQTLPTPADYNVVVANPDTRSARLLASGLLEDVTPDGRFLAYRSGGVRVAPDTNGDADVVIVDTVNNTSELALRTPSGDAAGSSSAAVSADGRFIISRSGPGVVPGDTSTENGTYLRDRQTGAVYRVSRFADGSPGLGANNIQHLNISDDGKIVCFETGGNAYLPGATGTGVRWTVISRTPLP